MMHIQAAGRYPAYAKQTQNSLAGFRCQASKSHYSCFIRGAHSPLNGAHYVKACLVFPVNPQCSRNTKESSPECTESSET